MPPDNIEKPVFYINGEPIGKIKDFKVDEKDVVCDVMKAFNIPTGFRGAFSHQMSPSLSKYIDEMVEVVSRHRYKQKKYRKRVTNRNKLYQKRKALGLIK